MDRQCSSCGGFCKKSGCERENVQPEHEPVAWLHTDRLGGVQAFTNEPPPSLKAQCQPLYTTPPQRTWVGLTDDDIRQLEKETTVGGYHGDYCPTWDLIEATEAKLKSKNA